MTSRSSRTTVPGRKPRKVKEQVEQPVDVLDCHRCDRPAFEVYAPVTCWTLDGGGVVLCGRCNEGVALLVRWQFVVRNSPHPFLTYPEDGTSRIRAVGAAERIDMSGSKVTFLP